MDKLKESLKKLFRRPVLAFANWLEDKLIKVDKWLNDLSVEDKQSLSKLIVYPILLFILVFMFAPIIFTLFTIILRLFGGN